MRAYNTADLLRFTTNIHRFISKIKFAISHLLFGEFLHSNTDEFTNTPLIIISIHVSATQHCKCKQPVCHGRKVRFPRMQVRLRYHNKYYILHNRIDVRESSRNQVQLILIGLPIVYSVASSPYSASSNQASDSNIVLPMFLLNFTASPAAVLDGRLPCMHVCSAPARLYEVGEVTCGEFRSSRLVTLHHTRIER